MKRNYRFYVCFFFKKIFFVDFSGIIISKKCSPRMRHQNENCLVIFVCFIVNWGEHFVETGSVYFLEKSIELYYYFVKCFYFVEFNWKISRWCELLLGKNALVNFFEIEGMSCKIKCKVIQKLTNLRLHSWRTRLNFKKLINIRQFFGVSLFLKHPFVLIRPP